MYFLLLLYTDKSLFSHSAVYLFSGHISIYIPLGNPHFSVQLCYFFISTDDKIR